MPAFFYYKHKCPVGQVAYFKVDVNIIPKLPWANLVVLSLDNNENVQNAKIIGYTKVNLDVMTDKNYTSGKDYSDKENFNDEQSGLESFKGVSFMMERVVHRSMYNDAQALISFSILKT